MRLQIQSILFSASLGISRTTKGGSLQRQQHAAAVLGFKSVVHLVH
ncbi:MAG: hypothetical protein SFY80_12575 [Verrucomicrobiota bacterium]|nr:hypothetical protein [Verrucomicrobiota bacterium]